MNYVEVISRSRLAYPALIKFGRFEQYNIDPMVYCQQYTIATSFPGYSAAAETFWHFLTQEKRKKKESTTIRNMFILFKNCAQKEANVRKKVYAEVKFLKNLEIFGMTDKTRTEFGFRGILCRIMHVDLEGKPSSIWVILHPYGRRIQ